MSLFRQLIAFPSSREFFLKSTRFFLRCKSLHTETNTPVVAVSDDKSMILCWHPEMEFPYECTRPITRIHDEMQEPDYKLKVQYYAEEKRKSRPTGPTNQELMKIFHTTRHIFDRKSSRQYRRQLPKERDHI